jgi:arylsulfatase
MIGSKDSYSNYPAGWAQAMNTPFRLWKGDVNSEGGTRNPMIITWPGHVQKGTRTQYTFVTDMLPTTLEIAGVTPPSSVRGIAQTPIQGASLNYSIKDARAPSHHMQQHYFLLGSAAMVKDGWKASFMYTPDLLDQFGKKDIPPQVTIDSPNAKWELYDLNSDFNERINVAAKKPEKLKELQVLFRQEMTANNGYPLINFGDLNAKMRAFMKARDAAKP